MCLEVIKATEADKGFLLVLRKLTMVKHLENAGLYLTDEEHVFRVNDSFECSHLITASGIQVGALKFRELDSKIEVMQIQIHPESQGKGLGKKVMEQVIEQSKNKQKIIELTVLKANPAKSLYQRLGFSITGEDEHEFHMVFKP